MELANIKAEQRRKIARGAGCTETYVKMVLEGDRDDRSVRARKIKLVAMTLNADLEKAYNKTNCDYTTINDAE